MMLAPPAYDGSFISLSRYLESIETWSFSDPWLRSRSSANRVISPCTNHANVQRQYWIVFTVILKNVAARDLATKRPLAPSSDSLKCSTRREAAPNMWDTATATGKATINFNMTMVWSSKLLWDWRKDDRILTYLHPFKVSQRQAPRNRMADRYFWASLVLPRQCTVCINTVQK